MKYKLLKRVGDEEAGSIVELDKITPAYVNKVKLFNGSNDEQEPENAEPEGEGEGEGEGDKKQGRGRQSSK